jgi:hypothetical protein
MLSEETAGDAEREQKLTKEKAPKPKKPKASGAASASAAGSGAGAAAASAAASSRRVASVSSLSGADDMVYAEIGRDYSAALDMEDDGEPTASAAKKPSKKEQSAGRNALFRTREVQLKKLAKEAVED